MKDGGCIWLIGGTQESQQIARAIAQAHLPCIITVTTESARSLYANTIEMLPKISIWVWVGRLNPDTVGQFLQEHNIRCILDASHPFAVEVSQMAITASVQSTIPYLRYERPGVERGQWNGGSGREREMGLTSHPANLSPHFPRYLDSFEALLASNILQQQRVLLTVGYRPLALFCPWQEQATLFARILPSVTAVEAALAARFTSDRLIAIRPPISVELERSLWQQWQISMVVTKASGTIGGEDVKRQIAADLGVTLVTIARPPIPYPQQTSELHAVLAFCKSHLL
jgi:precorrin-6A/cobalt-precorrin-6A reductase